MIESLLSFKRNTHIRCEYLVVGSGPGGSLTADYLSGKGKDVIVVEEGPYFRPVLEQSDINSSFPKLWRNGGIVPILSQCNFTIAEGNCVGGGTMINSALIHRIPPEIIGEWSERFRIVDLEEKQMSRFHDVIENELSVQVVDAGRNKANSLFKRGADKCGFKGMDVPMAVEIKNGRLVKKDMQKTYLKKASKKGVKIISDCRVTGIKINQGKGLYAETVYSNIDGKKYYVTISFKEIILCAGSIQTPLLLRRSGIKKNIGDNIHFHPTFRTVAQFDEPLEAHTVEMPSFQIKEFAPDISMGASVVAPSYTAVGLSANWSVNREHMKSFNNMATFYVMIRCSSRGSVRNLPFLKDSYIVRYVLNEKEIRNLSLGFARLAEVLFAAGAKRLFPAIDDCEPFTEQKESDYYLDHDLPLKRMNIMTIHSFSSCPMGENMKVCAVNSYGKLHGFKNIYINDASILPNSPGVNPQGPLMAIALRNLEKNFG